MLNFQSCCLKLRTFTALFAFMTVVFFTYPNLQASATTKKLSPEDRMSSTGRVAASVRKQLRKAGAAGVSTRSAIDNCINTPDDCEDGFSEGPAGGQAGGGAHTRRGAAEQGDREVALPGRGEAPSDGTAPRRARGAPEEGRRAGS